MDLTYNDSKSFKFFDSIRYGLLGDFDIISGLREISNNYDTELLKALQGDLSLYLSTELDEMECGFTIEEIGKEIEKRKNNNLEVPYKKPMNGKLKEVNDKVNSFPRIDTERLLFPYEF